MLGARYKVQDAWRQVPSGRCKVLGAGSNVLGARYKVQVVRC